MPPTEGQQLSDPNAYRRLSAQVKDEFEINLIPESEINALFDRSCWIFGILRTSSRIHFSFSRCIALDCPSDQSISFLRSCTLPFLTIRSAFSSDITPSSSITRSSPSALSFAVAKFSKHLSKSTVLCYTKISSFIIFFRYIDRYPS